jgi:hypothetical protein
MLLACIVGVIPLIGGLVGAGYILIRDALPVEPLGYKSVGRKVMKLSVVKQGAPGTKIEYIDSIKRNWVFAMGPLGMAFMIIPLLGWIVAFLLGIAGVVLAAYEIYNIFTDPQGIRLGDKMAGTMVVED